MTTARRPTGATTDRPRRQFMPPDLERRVVAEAQRETAPTLRAEPTATREEPRERE